jgi:hypothetical protein
VRHLKKKIYLLGKKAKFFCLGFILGPRHYITCHGMRDGLGAQAQAVMSAQLFASHFKINYLHTPFSSIYYHNGQEQQLESFMNLGYGELSIKDFDLPKLTRKRVSLWMRPNVIYELPHFHEFADLYPHLYSALRESFRDKFYANKKPPERSPSPTRVRVSVHVRRGDVSTENHAERYTPDNSISHCLRSISEAIVSANLEPVFTIISQGRETDFQLPPELSINFSLNKSIEETLNELIDCDVLVTAKSSLSYTAALITNAIVVYEQFWHNPLPDWIHLDKNHGVNKRVFIELLMRNRSTFQPEGGPMYDQK